MLLTEEQRAIRDARVLRSREGTSEVRKIVIGRML